MIEIFLRSVSMFSHNDYEKSLNPRNAQFNRLSAGDIIMRHGSNLSKEDIMRTFERFHIDSDDADDEDDERTPTVDHPTPKFP